LSNDISVALATYNGEKYLEEQLLSLAKQTVPPVEIVISDDCSSDRTVHIVNSFMETAPFPVLLRINRNRLGYTQNFLATARLCRGAYIAFCDQDDIWIADKLQYITDAIIAGCRKPDLILHTCRLLHADEDQAMQVFPDHLANPGLFHPLKLDPFAIVPGHSIVARRELVDGAVRLLALLPEQSLVRRGHDDLIYFLGAVAGVTQVLSLPLVYWRQHSCNTCGVPKPYSCHDAMQVAHLKMMKDLSDRWSSLSRTLLELSNEVEGEYSNNLKKSADIYCSRAQYYTLRAAVSDPAVAIWIRMMGLLKAHLRYGYTNGLSISSCRAFLRDSFTLLLPPQYLNRLIRVTSR